MTHLERITDLYTNYIYAGKLIDGFEKYYAKNVVMQEIGEEPRVGKDANRQHELTFVGSIAEFSGGAVLSVGANEKTGHTFVESWMEITFKGGQRVKMQQVAVQKWENSLIVSETFYHK